MEKILIPPLGLDKGQLRVWQKDKIWELASKRIYSYAEIADAIGIRRTFIYQLLQQISQEKHIPYHELLRFPHKPHTSYVRKVPYVYPRHESDSADIDVFDTMLTDLRELEANRVRILDTLQTLLPTKGE